MHRFKGNKVLQDEVMIDNQVLINYIQNNLKGTVGSEYAQAQGRITITSTTELSNINQQIALKNFKTKLTTKKQKGAVKLSWKACPEVKGESIRYTNHLRNPKASRRLQQLQRRLIRQRSLKRVKLTTSK